MKGDDRDIQKSFNNLFDSIRSLEMIQDSCQKKVFLKYKERILQQFNDDSGAFLYKNTLAYFGQMYLGIEGLVSFFVDDSPKREKDYLEAGRGIGEFTYLLFFA